MTQNSATTVESPTAEVITVIAEMRALPGRGDELGEILKPLVPLNRIGEAQHLLSETDRSITAIMFDSGFYTKSNFNREFTRITGMTPSDYRRSAGRSNA